LAIISSDQINVAVAAYQVSSMDAGLSRRTQAPTAEVMKIKNATRQKRDKNLSSELFNVGPVLSC
jgi:transcription initiation factor TFIIIB Brf1 subunit/transcription initiation factor TFIIB